MEGLKNIFKFLMDKFPFILEVTSDDGVELISSKKNTVISTIFFPIYFNKSTFYVEIDETHQNTIPLIKYILDDKFTQLRNSTDNILFNILEKKASYSNILESMTHPSLIIIKSTSSLDEVLEVLEASYGSLNCYYCKWNSYVVLLADFSSVNTHCESICETLCEMSLDKPLLCYEKLTSHSEIPKIAKDLIGLISMCENLKLRKNIIAHDNIIFENIMYNMSIELQYVLLNRYKTFFDSLDSDTLKTVETFLDMNLNITNTSKALFIHRNTLVYRLDKIKNDINLDIKNFKDALTFSIVYFIWKNLKEDISM